MFPPRQYTRPLSPHFQLFQGEHFDLVSPAVFELRTAEHQTEKFACPIVLVLVFVQAYRIEKSTESNARPTAPVPQNGRPGAPAIVTSLAPAVGKPPQRLPAVLAFGHFHSSANWMASSFNLPRKQLNLLWSIPRMWFL